VLHGVIKTPASQEKTCASVKLVLTKGFLGLLHQCRNGLPAKSPDFRSQQEPGLAPTSFFYAMISGNLCFIMGSPKPSENSACRQNAAFGWLLAALTWAASIACLSLIPSPPQMPGLLGWDKLQHAGAYALLTLLIAQALRRSVLGTMGAAWWPAGLTAVAFGGLLEILQLLMQAGRTAEWWDLLADALGACVCCVILRQIATVKSRQKEPAEKSVG
jgi:VanZ family protein